MALVDDFQKFVRVKRKIAIRSGLVIVKSDINHTGHSLNGLGINAISIYI
jgi:hypothetical protein